MLAVLKEMTEYMKCGYCEGHPCNGVCGGLCARSFEIERERDRGFQAVLVPSRPETMEEEIALSTLE